MKKTLIKILILLLSICTFSCLVIGCGNLNHEHEFDQKVTSEEFLMVEATCKARAKYYFSCGCGEIGTETFEHGNLAEHTYSVEYCFSDTLHWKEYSCGCMVEVNYQEHIADSSGFCSDCKQPVNPSEGVLYEISTDGTYAEVLGYAGTETRIKIAESYMDLPVKSISSNAFENTSIITLIIPDSITSIGAFAFRNCRSLISVVIGKGVINIGESAFEDCNSINIVNYAGSIDQWVEIDFDNFSANPSSCSKKLYVDNLLVTDIKLETATQISNSAFHNCNSLKSIEIPNGITKIGTGAFFGCTALEKIKMPDVVRIGGVAFYDCVSLNSIEVNASFEGIESLAFYNCVSLTTITIANKAWLFSRAFEGCVSLTIYCEGDKVLANRDDWNWSNCPVVWNCNSNDIATDGNIYTVVDGIRYSIKNGIVTVDRQARKIKGDIIIPSSITYKDKVYNVTSIGQSAFEECDLINSVIIGDKVTVIWDYAFRGCQSLIRIVVGNSVTGIGFAFEDCEKLVEIINKSTYITVTKGETSHGWIGKYAIVVSNDADSYASTYTTDENGIVTIMDGTDKVLVNYVGTDTKLFLPKDIIKINQYALYNCDKLKSLSIGNKVTNIGSNAFAHCTSLESIQIPGSVTSIGKDGFYGCTSLNKVNYTGTVDQWVQIDFSYDRANPLCYAKSLYINGKLATDVILTTATKVTDYAFYNCSSIKNIVIGDTVESVGEKAFDNCISLQSIKINNSVKSIGRNAFQCCSSLDSIELPNEISSIGWSMFYGCIALKSLKIPGSVTDIGCYAFNGCIGLETIELPSGVTSIGHHAFADCITLKSIIIPNGVESIQWNTFNNCVGLTDVIIGENVTVIEKSAFSGCNSLEKVYYSGNVEGWEKIDIGSSNNALTSSTIYYYIENESDLPADNGNYWHYDKNGNPAIW